MTEQKKFVLPENEEEAKELIATEQAVAGKVDNLDVDTSVAIEINHVTGDIMSDSGKEEIKPFDASTGDDELVMPEVNEELLSADGDTVHERISLSRIETIERLETIIEKPVEEVREEVDQLKQHYYKLRKQEVDEARAKYEAPQTEDGETVMFVHEPDILEDRMKNALQKFKEKKVLFLTEQEKHRENNLARKQGIFDDMIKLINDSDNINRRYNEFQQMQQAFKEITDIPAASVTPLWKSYQHYVEQFYDMLKINKELRDYDFKKNFEQKTALCLSAEALSEVKDIIVAFNELQRLHNEWREIGPVERELREQIWLRFKDASAVISKRYQSHFEEIKERERVNEEAKALICEKVEAIDIAELKSFAAWEEKTKEIVSLQGEWKNIGFASRKRNTQLFDRFRKACDEFFKTKSEYYKGVKDEFTKNLDLKRALCEKAEALKDSTEWQKATEKFIAMQKEWKAIGAVPRKYSDVIWKRFVGACDYFFGQKAKENAGHIETEKANLSAKQVILEKLQSLDETLPKDESEKVLRNLIAEWNGIGFVPYKEKDKLNTAFRAAADKQFDRLNIQGRNERLNAYVSTIKTLADSNKSKLYNERERLMRTYDRMKGELQTYENNMGFFNISSKQGNALVKELERNIKKLRDDMQLVVQKIEMIDENLKQ
ncbi:MAG: DUF349 domain-containing protein [Bacteroidales bacterium]